MKILYFLSYPLLYFTSFIAHSQEHDLPPGDPKGGIKTKITEYSKELKTYDFNDPNPIPVLLNNPKIYPYFTFDGYQKEAENKSFKIIELENDYIKVFVTPELGGKGLLHARLSLALLEGCNPDVIKTCYLTPPNSRWLASAAGRASRAGPARARR